MQWNEQDYSSRLRAAEKIAAEGMRLGHEPSAYEKSLIYGPNKRPRDLRDFSEVSRAQFRDGQFRTIWRQKKAPPMMSQTEAGRQDYNDMWDRIEGGRKVAGLKY